MLTIPGSVPINRRRSGTPGGASIDDSYLASMIFDTPPTKPALHGSTSPSLQKSPLHKSASALNELPLATSTPPAGLLTLPSSAGGPNKQHTPVTISHSVATSNYQGYARAPPPGHEHSYSCLLYTSPSPRDATLSRMPSSA